MTNMKKYGKCPYFLESVKEERAQEIKDIYCSIKNEIIRRLDEFRHKWKTGTEEEIFAELVFCILTPQSKAISCWATVENLLNKNFILTDDKDRLAEELYGVRFRNKKAEYIIEARKLFLLDGKLSIIPKLSQFSNSNDKREWLVRNVKGFGYKEASHFLRNLGFGEELAILDRHILKNLKWVGVIGEIPEYLARAKYFEIENKMRKFASEIDIPMSHLDLVLWYKETREIFK